MGIFIKSEVNEAILIIVKYYERKRKKYQTFEVFLVAF
jgi:hypothetical protein